MSDPSLDAIDFVRFCYRRRRVGWPELYDEMCAVAGRGLYRGWRFAELEDHGIGFSLSQTLELARIAGQVAVEEGDRRGRVTGRAAGRAADKLVGIPVIVEVRPEDEAPLVVAAERLPAVERVIEVRIVTPAPAIGADGDDGAVADPGADPISIPPMILDRPAVSSPSRPALAPSLIRSAAGAG